ncbi:YkoF family thiamine/hydroxymethylpyrimidine-binding protein [Aliikangiella sp. G2MR2-5]|uniref:YkoF family thiamine/hydroxymethylpyrimidine-binding protein n=1 Tax=Aliikangiella sp. G2MR2-5 TaxID=2788943 RepID=UPI0018AC32AD|nr:YkoF family thiamine/hydroxymethylpyrimidine-binding protein [Aliikangiella sp. G2MR2-5]
MKISVELSLYPLDDDFLTIIKDIVKRLNDDQRIECITNTMSTQIFGEFDSVMAVVNNIVKYSFETYGKQVFIAKFLNSDVAPSRQ